MFILFPASTDVPIYHWPFATGGLILLNVVVLVLQYTFPEAMEWFVLIHGQFNPITWFSSACMHSGILHLVSNMIGLALCGWVIEGKVGWWRMLLIYFGIAGISGAFEQAIMLFAESGGSLGASGVVFGMIAIAMLWAPENEVKMMYAGVFFFRPFLGTFDITISTLGFVLIGLEFATAAFTSFAMSSAVLHLFGAVPGFLIGYLMIRWRRVDCEGFDLVSIIKGQRGKRTLTVEQEKERVERKAQAKLDAQAELESGLAMVDRYISGGHYEMALNRFKMMRKTNRSLVMSESQLVTIIRAFDADEVKKPKMIPLIRVYLETYDRLKIPLTLMMARVLVLIQSKPREGLKALKSLTWADLDKNQKEFSRKLIERANQMIADGILEVKEDV